MTHPAPAIMARFHANAPDWVGASRLTGGGLMFETTDSDGDGPEVITAADVFRGVITAAEGDAIDAERARIATLSGDDADLTADDVVTIVQFAAFGAVIYG